jgi:hypothetical protein
MYVKFVENTLIAWKLWTADFHEFCCWLFRQGRHSWRMVSHCDLHCAHLFFATFELPKPLPHSIFTHYSWPINTTQLPMNFGCSKIFCIQKPRLHGIDNWQYFRLSCSYQIDVIQWHITTGGWNCDVWLHNELLKLISHVRIRSRDSHGCYAWLALTFSMRLAVIMKCQIEISHLRVPIILSFKLVTCGSFILSKWCG